MKEDKFTPDFIEAGNEQLSSAEDLDNFKLKAKLTPKIDFKQSLKDKALRLKSVMFTASVHKEWDEDNVSFDAEVKADLKKLSEGGGVSGIQKASVLFNKKF